MNDFKHVHAAMEILGFTSLEQDMIYKILACVLHVGNTCFTTMLVCSAALRLRGALAYFYCEATYHVVERGWGGTQFVVNTTISYYMRSSSSAKQRCTDLRTMHARMLALF